MSDDSASRDAASLLTFADFPPGRTFALGEISVSAEEIVAFAQQFDPQPFHVDADAAQNGPFGGLIASGWHTCALTMRLLVDGLLSQTQGMGSPGVNAIRFPYPVRPGDRLHAGVTVLEARPSERKRDRGVVTLRVETRNQAGITVLTLEALTIVARL
jgi:acyl dehydratase